MSLTFVNQGLDFIARVTLNKASPQNLTIHLFTNNHTPVVGDTTANYTECVLTGYAAAALSPSNWTGGTSGGVATYAQPAQTFTFAAYAGGTTIFGAYVTEPGGNLIGAELFSPSYAVPPGGGTLNYTPTYQDS